MAHAGLRVYPVACCSLCSCWQHCWRPGVGGGTNLPLCGPNPACQVYQYQDCACVVWWCVVALFVVHGARGRVKEVGAVALLCRSGGSPLPSCPRSHVCMSLAGPCDPCRGVQECVLVYVHAGGFLQRAHGGRGVVYCCTHGCGQQQLRVNDCIPVCGALHGMPAVRCHHMCGCVGSCPPRFCSFCSVVWLGRGYGTECDPLYHQSPVHCTWHV